ncbi:unnamed protein product [Larinioides sclopetarius]|uniref:Speckle-type POZ protein n=1 Tax=Larinioides sclopetarius TaxID=280406 RepID=A0AAV2BDS1_9ARAC
MSTEVQKISFIWNIEEFSYSAKGFNEPIISPCFKVESLNKTNWTLKCYPRGIRNTKFIAIKLCRNIDDLGPDNIKINFRSFILASDGSTVFENEKEHLSFTKGIETTLIRQLRGDFFKRPRVISPSDTLTICCEVWKSDGEQISDTNSSGAEGNFSEPFDDISKTVCEEISKEVSLGKPCHLHPSKFFARTKMVIQRRTFNYQINDFSCLPNPWSISFIPDSVYDETPPLLLTLNSSDVFKNVIIYIRPLIKKINESFLVKCIVKALATKGSPISVMNESHLFSPSMPLLWKASFENLTFLVDQNLYLNNDVLTLQFELSFSNDIEISNIEQVTYTIPSTSTRKKKTIMDDLLRFYEKQKYCDIKLQVRNETVQAHRAVLCSRSPVFQEMFETEMPDSKKVINDIDMTTLKHMLKFMYTENIENLNFENALKLYTVADKYEYEALRKKCSLILTSNIQPANVCEILRLSNGCGDDELKTSSLNYIRLHANEVFALGEWKSFVLNNVLLASEALGYVSSMIQKSYIESQLS